MRYLLDTDHLVLLQRQSMPEYAHLRSAMNCHLATDFYVSVVSFHEQMMGANAYIAKVRTRAGLLRGYQLIEQCLIDFNRFRVLPFDEPTVIKYEQFRSLRINKMDLRIAATALSHNLTLLTRNTVDFQRVPGLRIEDWTV